MIAAKGAEFMPWYNAKGEIVQPKPREGLDEEEEEKDKKVRYVPAK